MTKREKLIEGLRICTDTNGHKTCNDCPYKCLGVGCGMVQCRDAIEALQEDMDRIEELEGTIYNLRLYLTVLKKVVPEEVWESMEKRMSGLSGYVEATKHDATKHDAA